MKWTDKQQQAIDERNKNILVAAAAGSGKTAVLVERIKKLILEDGVAIDRMLIVTFTDAAASEMKEKIRKALSDSIDADPENSKLLREQLSLLPRANISTFHSFALNVIRNFFFLSDVEPGFSICDEAQKIVIGEEAMDLLLESRFARGDKEFYEFLDWYSDDKNQNKIRDIISNSYNILQSLPYPWQWLDEKIEELSMTPDQFKQSKVMDYFWEFIQETTDHDADMSHGAMMTLADEGLESMADTINDEWEAYEDIKEKAGNRDFYGVKQAMEAFPSSRLSAKRDEKETYEGVKAIVKAYREEASEDRKKLGKLFFSEPLDEQILDINGTKAMAEVLRGLLLEFDGLFKEGKKEKNLVDFNDIEHYCLDILNHEEAASYYREKFLHIFIDEYQDTNVLQEEIISKISRENNLFMVGDIKQSIYKFRLAEPSIFKGKYALYSNGDENSVKIDLNKNYRSKAKILHEINEIFKDIMEDYNEDAMLYPGLEYDGDYNVEPELKVVDMGTARDADEEIANLKSAEIEALEVARLIEENLGRTYFDSKAGVEKQIRPRDIVILMRSVKNYGEIFYNILKEKKIDAFIDDNEGYFDTMEINVFMNLLSVIDNKYQDVPLISALHSEIFGFSAEELGAVRIEHKEGSYAEAFMWYGENGAKEELKAKCAKAVESINKWKTMARAMALPQFIWQLLIETKYYILMGSMPGGSQRQANLRALVDKAESFSAAGQVSLYSFMKYIDAVKQRKVNMSQVKLVSEGEDLVRIMTIHKSKGLEFPMVIVAGLGKILKYTNSGDSVIIHKDIGLGLTLVNYKEHWKKQTLIQKLIQRQLHKEEVEEQIRVLYVALTRAKDLLYMTGTIRDEGKFREKKETGIGGDTSFLNMMKKMPKMNIINCNIFALDDTETEKKYIDPVTDDIFKGDLDETERQKILDKLNYSYPYKSETMIKSKYSVSELNHYRDDKNTNVVLAVPKFRQGEQKITASQRGTIYHGFMERLDFVRASREGEEYIRDEAAKYIDAGILLAEEVEAISFDKLVKFFATDIGKRCVKAEEAGTLRRETPFNLVQTMEGEEVIVQGIIDCYFQEDGKLVLLDYKTNWIDKDKPIEEEKARLAGIYRKQMEIYALALEKATGMAVKEAMLYLFSAEETVEIPLD